MRFFSISVIYFRNSQVNVDLLISFRPPRNKQNLVLEEIKFFDKKQDLLNYIKSNNLEIIDTVSDVVLQGIKKIIEDYLSGKKVNIFDGILELNVDLQLDEKFKSEFSHDVVECLTQLKYGEVVTYSEIGKFYSQMFAGNPFQTVCFIKDCHFIGR